MDYARNEMATKMLASRIFKVRIFTVISLAMTVAFTIISIVFLKRETTGKENDNFFIDFVGYGYLLIFTVLALSLTYFSNRLIKTLGRLSGGKDDSTNSHEVLLRQMILIFTVTYGLRAVYNGM